MNDPNTWAFVLLLIGAPIICIVPAFIQALRINRQDEKQDDREQH